MLEKVIEKYLIDQVKAKGGIAYKFTSPQRRSVPDRIVLLPIPPEHRDIVAKYFRFVEAKRTGGKPTEGQAREHAFLRGLGYVVDVMDSKESCPV